MKIVFISNQLSYWSQGVKIYGSVLDFTLSGQRLEVSFCVFLNPSFPGRSSGLLEKFSCMIQNEGIQVCHRCEAAVLYAQTLYTTDCISKLLAFSSLCRISECLTTIFVSEGSFISSPCTSSSVMVICKFYCFSISFISFKAFRKSSAVPAAARIVHSA